MPTRPRTAPKTDDSPVDPSDSPSPPTPAREPERIVSPDVAARRGPTVVQLMIDVMRRVRFVSKDQRNTEQRFDFRGIDDVINALGPAMREVGIIVLPTVEWSARASTKTTRGKDTRETTIRTRWTFYGPAGDSISAVTEGESLDAGDKGTAKAQTVAWRVAMIQAFALPTDEPDPDHDTYQRVDEYDDDRRGRGRRDDRGRDERNGDRWQGRPTMRDHYGTDDERAEGEDRRRVATGRVNVEDEGDERGDLIDTSDPEEAAQRALMTLKDKLRHYRIKKDEAADMFAELFGEELPTAAADLIDKYTELIVAIGGLPEIDKDPGEQHPMVRRLMAVREAVGPDEGPGAGGGDDNQ